LDQLTEISFWQHSDKLSGFIKSWNADQLCYHKSLKENHRSWSEVVTGTYFVVRRDTLKSQMLVCRSPVTGKPGARDNSPVY
jgi:hypothetical protein